MILQTGLAVSPYAKNRLGFLGLFGIAIGCAVSAMICAMFLKDSRTMRLSQVSNNEAADETKECDVAEDKKGHCEVITTIFDVRNIKRAFSATLKRRPFNTRPFLLILASNFILYVFMINGRDSQLYLYTREGKMWSACINLPNFIIL